MKLNKIDIKNMIAVGDDQADFILLIERGNEIEPLEISAPQAAYEGLQQVSDSANTHCLQAQKRSTSIRLEVKSNSSVCE